MVGFVVDDEQAAPGLEAAEHAAQDEVFVLAAFYFAAVCAQLAIEGGSLVAGEQTRQKFVIVGDDQAMGEFAECRAIGRGQQIALAVVVLRFLRAVVAGVRDQYLEAVADGDAGRDDEKIIAIAGVVAVFAPIQVVVKNQAGHDHGFARACCHLEGEAWQLVGRVVAGSGLALAKLVEDVRTAIGFFGQFVEPDGRFNGFLLGEKQFLVRCALGVGKPVAEQVSRYPAGDAAIAGLAPVADLFAQLVDQMFAIIRLEIVEVEHAALRLLGERHLRYVGREDAATFANILVVQVALDVGCVVTPRLRIGCVENGIFGSCHEHLFEFKLAILSSWTLLVRPA